MRFLWCAVGADAARPGQVLATMESAQATTGQLATSLCLSALPGWLGRVKLLLDGGLRMGKNKPAQHAGDSRIVISLPTTTAQRLCILRCNLQSN